MTDTNKQTEPFVKLAKWRIYYATAALAFTCVTN